MKKSTLGVIFGLLIAVAVLVGVAVGQSYPKFGGPMTGIVDWNGDQFSSAKPFPVSSYGTTVTTAVTRATGTTQYTANTGWNNGTPTVFTFSNVCRYPGSTVLIPQISVWSSANPATKLQGILWLFTAVPGTIIGDNAAFTIAAADFANLTAGSQNGIPFALASAQSGSAANSGVSLVGGNYHVTCTGQNLYGMVQVVNTYTPASAEVLTVSLGVAGVN